MDQVFDERVTNALHMMQDHVQQTTVISQRRSQKTLPEQAALRTKGDAAMEAAIQTCERQEEDEQKYQGRAEAETTFNGSIKDTLEKQKRSKNTSRP